jgi:hypothetical protein
MKAHNHKYQLDDDTTIRLYRALRLHNKAISPGSISEADTVVKPVFACAVWLLRNLRNAYMLRGVRAPRVDVPMTSDLSYRDRDSLDIVNECAFI